MPTLCAVYGCGNNATKDSEKGFFRIPKVIRNSDPNKVAEKLSRSRRRQWFAKINHADLTDEKAKYTRVCGDHFVTGTLFLQYIILSSLNVSEPSNRPRLSDDRVTDPCGLHYFKEIFCPH